MTKISIDVEEIKKGIKDRALIAAGQLSEFAKKAQTEIESKIPKELSQKEVLKKVEQVVEIVKSQEFMKNPKVQELTRKIATLSEQIEQSIAKNVVPFVNEARSRYNDFRASAQEHDESGSGIHSAKKEAGDGESKTSQSTVSQSTGAKKTVKKGTSKSDV